MGVCTSFATIAAIENKLKGISVAFSFYLIH